MRIQVRLDRVLISTISKPLRALAQKNRIRNTVFLLILTVVIPTRPFAQDSSSNGQALYISAGRISFGTGDFFGYNVNVGYAKRLSSNRGLLEHLEGQVELCFEYGNNQPIIINPTADEFFGQFYYSTANIAIVPKIGYYPFNRTFFKGLNISAGLAFGYTNQNREFQATLFYDPVSQINVRRSYLEYINEFIFGYRVSVGYDYPFINHLLLGARFDFENYTNLGDINATLGAKIAYEF
jgi:hypothetical protein